MPTYRYKCAQCQAVHEAQHKAETRLRVLCRPCGVLMDWQFPMPFLRTNTTFLVGRDDGFGNDRFSRAMARQRAKAAGISTAGKTFFPGMARLGHPFDPEAWISHADPRGEIAARCRERGTGCTGTINVKGAEPGPNPNEGPYVVAEDIVQEEVDQIVSTEHEDHITPEKRSDLVEATRERLSGNQDPGIGSLTP